MAVLEQIAIFVTAIPTSSETFDFVVSRFRKKKIVTAGASYFQKKVLFGLLQGLEFGARRTK
jgi:hypothetical protein